MTESRRCDNMNMRLMDTYNMGSALGHHEAKGWVESICCIYTPSNGAAHCQKIVLCCKYFCISRKTLLLSSPSFLPSNELLKFHQGRLVQYWWNSRRFHGLFQVQATLKAFPRPRPFSWPFQDQFEPGCSTITGSANLFVHVIYSSTAFTASKAGQWQNK